MDVACINSECPELGVVKANPRNWPVDEIQCGACGQTVDEVTP